MKTGHKFKDWLMAVRPWSFPASAMPVIVTLGYLFSCGRDIIWVNGVWALLNIIVFQWLWRPEWDCGCVQACLSCI